MLPANAGTQELTKQFHEDEKGEVLENDFNNNRNCMDKNQK